MYELTNVHQNALPFDDEDEMISTFVMRFVTKADYETVKKSFEQLDASIDFMELVTNGTLREFLKSASGQKLARGLNIKEDDLDEYVICASFIFGDADDSKRTLISTLCQSFPLFIVREEKSNYIMANNKGLAKGIIDTCNEDEVELLSLFLTGFEKYKVLVHYLYWCEPYKTEQAKDIMIKWDKDALISLAALRTPKEVPIIWQEFLASVDGVQVSKNEKDSGTWISFESMLEDVKDDAETKKKIDADKNLINVVSLRGVSDYSLFADGEEVDTDVEVAK